MDILENELVLKYFGCRSVCTVAHFINVGYDEHERCMSTRILDAMQQPIRKGDRYLLIANDGLGNPEPEDNIAEFNVEGFHPYLLRLPDRFQKQECPNVELTCSCGKIVRHDQPDVRQPTPEPEKCECDCHHGEKINIACFKCFGNSHTMKTNEPEKGRMLDPGVIMEGWHDQDLHNPKDEVEAKIKILAEKYRPLDLYGSMKGMCEEELRELVALARKQ